MPFRDQSHIDQVRDALWKRYGGASVMIGSGFSRNARKTRPDAEDLPTWRKLGCAIHNKLYPQRGRGRPGNNIAQTAVTDNILRLAQEYEAAFGRPDLNRFLRQLIRDEDYKPGEAHLRLLRLPWHDVFTTNWDTLLERASDSVAECNYGIVRTMDEIPLACEQRIVKLHGSFPDYFPLILTEEDYRTYPAKFAPFVNTAQQAMMETVFCLIGFSGDDPNFLHWSGWVRDNLGVTAPKIYLAGWLELSPHRRRMLENRNVVPIDLAQHPKARQWPEHLRHDYATEWILHTLERGRPYDVTDWPSPLRQQYSSIPEHLQPVHELISEIPKEESLDRPKIDSEDLPDSVKQTLDIWTHNRRIYPNWLAVPASARQLLSLCTNEWQPGILRALPRFAPVNRLNAIRELVWRREILLDPISSKIESAAEGVLEPIDCQTRTIDGLADPEIDWATVREAWRTIALALVTAARHRFDHDLFHRRIEALSPFLDDDSEVGHRIHHERCLWALYSMDFEALEGLLKDWQTEHCDPAWMMRKVAILYELNRISDAVELFERALSAIRRIPDNDRSLAGPSREGWALWLKWALERRQWRAHEGEKPPVEGHFRRRWRELASLKCDALSEKHAYTNAITASSDKKEGPPFDLGVRPGPGWRISNDEYNRWVSARRVVRLSEVAGLPSSSSDVLKPAIDELSISEPELAVRLVLRTLGYDEDPILKRVLSRTRMAAMPTDLAKTLAEICNRVINYAHPRMFKTGKYPRNVFWIERMRVAMEVLSRLVLRLEPKRVETIFDKALEHYRNRQVAQEPWLADPVRSLLKRSWEALPEDRRTAHALDVLGAPILGMDNFTSDWPHYPEPGELLQDDLPPPVRTDENEGRWQEIISFLVRGLLDGGDARKRAAHRIVSVALWKRLNETEAVKVAQALWNEQHTGPNDFPGETELFEWVFLLLPEPEPGLAEKRFRHKWLASKRAPQEKAPSLDDILWQVGMTMFHLKNHERLLSLSQYERSYLVEVVKQWSDIPLPRHYVPFFESQLYEPIRNALKGLPTVIAEIKIPGDIGEKLYQKMQVLNDSGIPAFGLIAGLVKAMPNHFDELALLMRTGLAAENEALAKGAATALYHWLTTSDRVASQIQPPPSDLVREIGIMIAARRKGPLSQALQIAKWVFDEGNDEQKEAIRQLSLDGLGYLLEELRYDREHDPDDDIDIPLLRWRSAQFAVSLSEHGYGDDPTVSRWLQIAEDDPLPEVRYVKSPAFVRQLENEERIDDVDDEPRSHTE